MLRSLKKWFATKRHVSRRGVQARPRLESFEARDLPSAGHGLFAAHAFHFGSPAQSSSMKSASAVSYGQLHAASGTGHEQTLVATLSGVTGASGQVKFTPSTTAGQNTFVLSVSGLTANQTYSVQVDGTAVGQVSTDTSGNGSVTLSNLTAAIAAGSVVTVVDTSTTPSTTVLTGTLAASDGCHGGHRLTASLTGSMGSGSATFHPDENSLKVAVSGLTAGATYTVQVGDSTTTTSTTVGTITTDANSSGKLSVSNLAATIATGTTISVVDSSGTIVLTGTFGTSSSGATLVAAAAKKR